MRPALLACTAAIIIAGCDADAENAIVGRAVAYDGDGVYVYPTEKRVKIRLWGIDAAELGTPDGERSFAALASLVDGKRLSCQPPPDEATYPMSGNRFVALCRLPGGDDIASKQVQAGFARDWPKFSRGYYAD